MDDFTRSEKAVLDLLHLKNEEIASQLGRTRKTVEHIVSGLYNKTGIRDRAGVLYYWLSLKGQGIPTSDTLRLMGQFAAAALTGLVIGKSHLVITGEQASGYAKVAYQLAEAMIGEREKWVSAHPNVVLK